MEFLTSDEAERHCRERLLQDIGEEELNEIIDIIKSFNIESLEAEAYGKVAFICYSSKSHANAVKFYQMALDSSLKSGQKNRFPLLYNSLGACKYAEMLYEEALFCFDKANIYAVMFGDMDIEIKSLNNIAMTYRRLSWLDKAIEYADTTLMKLKNMADMSEFIIRAHMIKINCYIDKSDYPKALEISYQLIDVLGDDSVVEGAHIYNNIGNVCVELGKYNEGIKYFNKSEEIRKVNGVNKLSHTLIDKTFAYIKLNLYAEAEAFLKSGIELALRYNDYDYVLRGYEYLINIYEALKCNEKIEATYSKIIELLKDKKPEELKKIYIQISEYYIKQGKLDKADEFMKQSSE
jgi:tetratricopeptide (TPR) repeat protein